MAFAQSPSTTSELYSEPEEVKQYHAFMYTIRYTIPLLCIILCMSLFLLHLKKKASVLPYPPPLPPTVTETPSSFIISAGPLIDKLPTIVFDEEFKARDSVCCVCLGEFEMKEELMQVPSCKHMFHNECIRSWLVSSTTCPLCRCSVIDNNGIVRPQTSHAVLLPAATSIQLAATS